MELTFHHSKFANPESLCLTPPLLPINKRSEIHCSPPPPSATVEVGWGFCPALQTLPFLSSGRAGHQGLAVWAIVWAKGSSGTLASCISWPVHSKSSDRRGRDWWVWYPGRPSTNSQNEVLWLGLDTDETAVLYLSSSSVEKSNQIKSRVEYGQPWEVYTHLGLSSKPWQRFLTSHPEAFCKGRTFRRVTGV